MRDSPDCPYAPERGKATPHARRSGIDLEVDGGIEPDTAPLAVQAGARVLVAGSAIYRPAEGVAAAMRRLFDAVARAQ